MNCDHDVYGDCMKNLISNKLTKSVSYLYAILFFGIVVNLNAISEDQLIQNLQAEPLPSGYAINNETVNFEIKLIGANPSTYTELVDWFSVDGKTSFL